MNGVTGNLWVAHGVKPGKRAKCCAVMSLDRYDAGGNARMGTFAEIRNGATIGATS